MFNIEFYEKEDGSSDIRDFLEELRKKAPNDKDSRIQYKQLAFYIELLSLKGTYLGKEVTKNIKEDIWELRPGNNRVFYFFYDGNTYVLLHHFRKKSQKTPAREIEQAIRERDDYLSRKRGKR